MDGDAESPTVTSVHSPEGGSTDAGPQELQRLNTTAGPERPATCHRARVPCSPARAGSSRLCEETGMNGLVGRCARCHDWAMRSRTRADASQTGALRLLLSAVVAVLVSLAPTTSRACPMGAESESLQRCACSCCELASDDSVRRAPCCVEQASLDAPPLAIDRVDPGAQALEAPPVTLIAAPRPTSYTVRSSLAPMVRSTGPPTWLRCCSLLR